MKPMEEEAAYELTIAMPKRAAVPPPSRRKYPDPVQPTDGQVQTF